MDSKVVEILKVGGVGIIPTDTVYGLVGQAKKQATVERIVRIKNRSDGKGFIVLVSSIEDLKDFGVVLSDQAKKFLTQYWPGAVSVVLPIISKDFDFLIGPEQTIAFRLPNKPDLIEILKQTGPLVAPSANPEGQPPAKNIVEAEKYFGPPGRGGGVDFYEAGGELNSAPSTLVRIVGNEVQVLRPGVVEIVR